MKNLDKILIGIVIVVPLLIVGTILYEVVDSNIYKDIESKITVEQRYNGVENKKAAVDKCMQILETNNFTMYEASTESHGTGSFVVVKGRRYKQGESK